MLRGCIAFLSCLCAGIVLTALIGFSGAWYYQRYPTMHVLFFGVLILLSGLFLGTHLFLRLRKHEQHIKDHHERLATCQECDRTNQSVEWCRYSDRQGKHYGQLCSRCQRRYHAHVE